MKATTREDLNLKDDETMCERCVHEDICRREQCGEPYSVIRSCFDFEEKRPHGKWKMDSEYGFIFHCSCSECNSDVMKYISGSENWWLNSTPNFCPNCGADMRGDAE